MYSTLSGQSGAIDGSVAAATRLEWKPYVGPQPLQPGSPLAGRNQEIQSLFDAIISERIVVLVSPSGAGKTSLINAGLLPRLHEEGFTEIGPFRVNPVPVDPAKRSLLPSFRQRPDDHRKFVAAVLEQWNSTLSPDKALPADKLETIRLAQFSSYVRKQVGLELPVIIFDQFEEIVTSTPYDETAIRNFFEQVGELLADRQMWALFSLREEYLATLELYREYVPSGLAEKQRLGFFSHSNAVQAIQIPVSLTSNGKANFNKNAAELLADRLAMFHDPHTHQLVTGRHVEPFLLQVVCSRIWNQRKSDVITASDIPKEEEINGAVGDFYNDLLKDVSAKFDVSEATLRDWFESELMEGLRRRQTQSGPTKSARDVDILRRFQEGYLLRPDFRNDVTWYELSHDRLVDAIRDSNANWRLQLPEPDKRLIERARLWNSATAHNDDYLLRGAELGRLDDAIAAGKLYLTPEETRFVDASRAARRSRRREKYLTFVMVAAIVLAILFVSWAWHAQREAQIATGEAQIAKGEAQIATGVADQRIARAKARESEAKAREVFAEKTAAERVEMADERVKMAAEQVKMAAERVKIADTQAASALASAESSRKERADAEAAANKANQRSEETKRMNAALQDIGQAYLLISKSARDSSLNDAKQSLDVLARNDAPVDPTIKIAVLNASLSRIKANLSRALRFDCFRVSGNTALSPSRTTNNAGHEDRSDAFVQSLGYYPSEGDLFYVTQTGDVGSLRVPESPQPSENCSLTPRASLELSSGEPDFRFPSASVFSGGGSAVAIGSSLGRIKTINKDREQPLMFHAKKSQITDLSFSSQGRFLAAASALWSISLWDFARPDSRGNPKLLYHYPSTGLSGWIHWLRTFHGTTNESINALGVFAKQNDSGSESLSGIVAVGEQNGAVLLRRITNGKPLLRIPGPFDPESKDTVVAHKSPITAVAFDESGTLFATGAKDGSFILWQLPTNLEELARLRAGTLPTHTARFAPCPGGATALAFSPGNQFLAVGCQDGNVHLEDISNAFDSGKTRFETVAVLKGTAGGVTSLVFDPVRRYLFSSGSGQQIELWSILTREQFAQFHAVGALLDHELDQLAASQIAPSAIELQKLQSRVTEITNLTPPAGWGKPGTRP